MHRGKRLWPNRRPARDHAPDHSPVRMKGTYLNTNKLIKGTVNSLDWRKSEARGAASVNRHHAASGAGKLPSCALTIPQVLPLSLEHSATMTCVAAAVAPPFLQQRSGGVDSAYEEEPLTPQYPASLATAASTPGSTTAAAVGATRSAAAKHLAAASREEGPPWSARDAEGASLCLQPCQDSFMASLIVDATHAYIELRRGVALQQQAYNVLLNLVEEKEERRKLELLMQEPNNDAPQLSPERQQSALPVRQLSAAIEPVEAHPAPQRTSPHIAGSSAESAEGAVTPGPETAKSPPPAALAGREENDQEAQQHKPQGEQHQKLKAENEQQQPKQPLAHREKDEDGLSELQNADASKLQHGQQRQDQKERTSRQEQLLLPAEKQPIREALLRGELPFSFQGPLDRESSVSGGRLGEASQLMQAALQEKRKASETLVSTFVRAEQELHEHVVSLLRMLQRSAESAKSDSPQRQHNHQRAALRAVGEEEASKPEQRDGGEEKREGERQQQAQQQTEADPTEASARKQQLLLLSAEQQAVSAAAAVLRDVLQQAQRVAAKSLQLYVIEGSLWELQRAAAAKMLWQEPPAAARTAGAASGAQGEGTPGLVPHTGPESVPSRRKSYALSFAALEKSMQGAPLVEALRARAGQEALLAADLALLSKRAASQQLVPSFFPELVQHFPLKAL
ncbi:hypothetical protein cyc_04679 [Cyclospora cayetanensis]|uniref:Uncharacterized protein n=1 Tax=Cyclospora cayetanensis TaxID=88456 RepID=A0A1D3CRF3_9EIME|nr:hypothetical protein cyc_04679 [Cyclospora cayetanensis]